MLENIGNGKADGLVAYLGMLAEKGRVPASTITSLKSAIKAVFTTVDGDDWQNVDMRKFDLDEYMGRFQNLSMGKYDKASYTTYRNRINRAVKWYVQFLQDPGWAPSLKQTARVSKQKTKAEPIKHNNVALSDVPEAEIISSEMTTSLPSGQPTASKLMSFPFPLHDGTIATLYLPPEISSSDLNRLQNFLQSLIIKEDA